MSWQATEWVQDHAAVESPAELAVLMAFAARADAHGCNTYPGPTEVARRARVSIDYAKKLTRRLRAQGHLIPCDISAAGTRVYLIAGMGGLQSPGAHDHPGTTDTRGACAAGTGVRPGRGPSSLEAGDDGPPKPSLEPSQENRPDARAGARGTGSTSDDLAEQIVGILQRGIDGLASDAPAKRPTRAAVAAALAEYTPSRQTALALAVEVRSIAQSQNRAPNIAGLYAKRLAATATRERAAA